MTRFAPYVAAAIFVVLAANVVRLWTRPLRDSTEPRPWDDFYDESAE